MPGPVSETTRRTRDSSAAALTTMRVPEGQYLTALSTRFDRTCSRARGSPSTGREARRELRGEAHALLLRPLAEESEHDRHDPLQLHAFAFELELVRLELRELQHVLDQTLEALRVSLDDVEEPVGGRRVLEGAGLQRLGGRPDGRDRRAQLVRGVGDEVAAKRLQPAELGHVDEDQQEPLVVTGQRGGLHQETSRLEAGELDLDGGIVGSLAGAIDDGVELRVPHRLDEELADGVGAEQERRPERRVHQDDPPVAIDHDDALVHRLEDAALQIALGAELAERGREASGETVEGLAQAGELVVARKTRADFEVPLCHATGRVGELPHRRGHPLGQHVREDEGEDQRDAASQPDEAPHVALGGVDLAEGHGDADDPRDGTSRRKETAA